MFSSRIVRGRLLMLILAASVAMCAGNPERPPSDHFDGRRFFNPTPAPDAGVFRVLRHVLFGRGEAWPERQLNAPQLQLAAKLGPNQVALTFVNHATMLIQFGGYNIVTDPVWSDRIGALGIAGPHRVVAPGIPFEQLPRIDLILISHNHYDHLDLATLKRLATRDAPLTFAPLGDGPLLRSAGLARVQEFDWWESAEITPDLSVTFAPAQHNSGRGLFDARRSLWGGFMIQHGARRVFFAGDTAYASHFVEIRRRLGAPDVALLPIGSYEPADMMRPYHMNPAEAVQAQLDLGARYAAPIHYGAFHMTAERVDQPIKDLAAAREAAGVPEERFPIFPEGQTRILTCLRR